ncbi:P-type conjugative transfer protein TrbL [Pseudothauera hydrothermalis]|jgi:type IV secretion system protein TrbL|uniref:P-type conjugative transfer protein TrbL n=1 Tax=Pseudothauera hydrothermalis TaxID=2184083 RepID=UPI000E097141|nr:P-type conjugative transfer protein TrbL [Pseudothauera hydrothermalis]HCF1890558.1 P-type conjugative transfer protein TrbL [Pseudomonas aeruginosa]
MKTMTRAILSGGVLVLHSSLASANLTNQGILDQVVTDYATRAASWQHVIIDAASWLFWTLVVISMVWTFGMMALRKADIGEFFAELVRFIIFTGFFWWLLVNGPAFANSIIQSLARIGEQAAGVSSVTPSGIVDVGFMIWKQAINNLSAWSPVDSLVGAVLSAAIMLLLALVAINMLLMLIAAWLLAYAGIFFLGFGGSRWTSDMAINYYKTVLGVAVQIMTMVLLVGIGNDMLSTFYTRMNQNVLNFEELGVMLVFCMALLSLVNRVPPMVGGIITGSGIGSAGGIGNFGTGAAVGAVMGAAGMAAGAASVAGSAVMDGAANLAGGGSAIKAAFDKAQASMSSGSDMPSMGGMSNSSAGGHGTNAGGDGNAGSSPFAQAAGFGGNSESGAKRAVSLAAGTAGNLAKGIGAAAAEKIKDRVADTAGGRLASSLRSSSPSFEGNSLAGTAGHNGHNKSES